MCGTTWRRAGAGCVRRRIEFVSCWRAIVFALESGGPGGYFQRGGMVSQVEEDWSFETGSASVCQFSGLDALNGTWGRKRFLRVNRVLWE